MKTKEEIENLAKAHWEYVKSVLVRHGVENPELNLIGFHYMTAFIHGYKHGIEDKEIGK